VSVQRSAAVIMLLLVSLLIAPWSPPPLRAQGVDVFLNVTGGGTRKLNIAVPEFTVVSGTDTQGTGKQVAAITGADLSFSGLFSVVAGTGAIPANNPGALQQSWKEFAAAGAHAALHGLLTIRPDRLDGEMRLYDLTTAEHRLITTKKFEVPGVQGRRLAHKIADEVVLQFTGEPGVADTKIAYVSGPRGAKEIVVADYDGAAPTPLTRNGSINLTPGPSRIRPTSRAIPTSIARFPSSAGPSRHWPPSSASTRRHRSAPTARASR
jgi:TolB protein